MINNTFTFDLMHERDDEQIDRMSIKGMINGVMDGMIKTVTFRGKEVCKCAECIKNNICKSRNNEV
jgi:hypothetical protein